MNEEKDKELLKSVGSYIESSNKRLALSLTRKNVFLKELSQIVSKAHELTMIYLFQVLPSGELNITFRVIRY